MDAVGDGLVEDAGEASRQHEVVPGVASGLRGRHGFADFARKDEEEHTLQPRREEDGAALVMLLRRPFTASNYVEKVRKCPRSCVSLLHAAL